MSRSWDSYKTKDDSLSGCFAIIVAIAIAIFLGPWVVMHAWWLIAVQMFGAPAMPYWTAFFGTWAVHILTQQITTKKN